MISKNYSITYIFLITFLISFQPSANETFSKKILLVDSQSGEPYRTVRHSMLNELQKRGYTQEAGYHFEYQSLSHYHGAAKSLWEHRIKKTHYDLIYVAGTLAGSEFSYLAKDHSTPIVFSAVTDPVGLDMIEDFSQPPHRNFTGVSYHIPVNIRMDFIREILPNVKNIGLVYADMDQSHSYNLWLQELTSSAKWEGVTIHYREVDFVPSDGGHRRMAQVAKQYIQELNPIVDVFLSPCDQMGTQEAFAKMVASTATKPLIGIGRRDVSDGWGATASIYPDEVAMGVQAANMIDRIFMGEPLLSIHPERPKEYGVIINQTKMHKFGLEMSENLRNEATIIY